MTKISEAFVQYVWKCQHLNTRNFTTATGQTLEVIHPGTHNHHAGPDFLHAQLRIDGTLWCGHIEIHLRSSDWIKHGHEGDEQYKNVILHVVMEHDREIFLHQPNDLQVLELHPHIDQHFLADYHQWLSDCSWVPCEKKAAGVEQVHWESLKAKLLIERMQERVRHMIAELEISKGNWAQLTLREFFKAFGFKSNAGAMALLADSIPYTIIARHRTDPLQIEALIFGQAGMLNQSFIDDYPQSLQREYRILQFKYGIRPIDFAAWNLGRIRPHNSPWIRLSQISSALCATTHLTTMLLHGTTEEITTWLKQPVHPYWQKNYAFDRPTAKPTRAMMGNASIETILINASCRLQFAFGKFHDEPRMIEKALGNLEKLSAEDNMIVRHWKAMGIETNHAADSQALIQLYTVYCTNERCLDCAIGHKLLHTNNT